MIIFILVGSANKIHGNYYNGTFLTKYDSSLTRQWTRQTDSYFGKAFKRFLGKLIFITDNKTMENLMRIYLVQNKIQEL